MRRILRTWRHCLYMVKIHHQFLSNYSKYPQLLGYKAFTQTHKIKPFSKVGKEAPQNIKISLFLLRWQQPVAWPSTPAPWPWVSTAAQSIHPTSEHTNGQLLLSSSSFGTSCLPTRVFCLALEPCWRTQSWAGWDAAERMLAPSVLLAQPKVPAPSPTDFPAQNKCRSPRKTQ